MTAEHAPFQWGNIVDIGEAIKPAMERFQKSADEAKVFATQLRKDIKEMPAQTCVMHECNLILDWDATFSASWFAKKPIRKFEPCILCEQERLAPLVNEKFRKMGIPEKCLHATFENFIIDTPQKKEVLDCARLQVSRNRGFIIMSGEKGTGKSHLASAIIKASSFGKFITEADLIGDLRKTYETHKGQEELVEKYRKTKVLVLDEIDLGAFDPKTEKGKDIQPFLYRILADRYDKDKLTVITSNEDLNTILEVLGERIRDRIKASFVNCKFTWQSYRGKDMNEYVI